MGSLDLAKTFWLRHSSPPSPFGGNITSGGVTLLCHAKSNDIDRYHAALGMGVGNSTTNTRIRGNQPDEIGIATSSPNYIADYITATADQWDAFAATANMSGTVTFDDGTTSVSNDTTNQAAIACNKLYVGNRYDATSADGNEWDGRIAFPIWIGRELTGTEQDEFLGGLHPTQLTYADELFYLDTDTDTDGDSTVSLLDGHGNTRGSFDALNTSGSSSTIDWVSDGPTITELPLQTVYPTSDVTNGWSSGGWSDLDETTPSDVDFAYTSDDPSGDELEVHLGNPTDAADHRAHRLRWRHVLIDGGSVAASAGTGCDLTVKLRQGTTEIATVTVELDDVTSWEYYSLSLTVAEMASITDYTDLRAEFTATGGGGSAGDQRGAGVSWVAFESPLGDVSGDGALTFPAKTVTATGSVPITGGSSGKNIALFDVSGFVIGATGTLSGGGGGAITGDGAVTLPVPYTFAYGDALVSTGKFVDANGKFRYVLGMSGPEHALDRSGNSDTLRPERCRHAAVYAKATHPLTSDNPERWFRGFWVAGNSLAAEDGGGKFTGEVNPLTAADIVGYISDLIETDCGYGAGNADQYIGVIWWNWEWIEAYGDVYIDDGSRHDPAPTSGFNADVYDVSDWLGASGENWVTSQDSARGQARRNQYHFRVWRELVLESWKTWPHAMIGWWGTPRKVSVTNMIDQDFYDEIDSVFQPFHSFSDIITTSHYPWESDFLLDSRTGVNGTQLVDGTGSLTAVTLDGTKTCHELTRDIFGPGQVYRGLRMTPGYQPLFPMFMPTVRKQGYEAADHGDTDYQSSSWGTIDPSKLRELVDSCLSVTYNGKSPAGMSVWWQGEYDVQALAWGSFTKNDSSSGLIHEYLADVRSSGARPRAWQGSGGFTWAIDDIVFNNTAQGRLWFRCILANTATGSNPEREPGVGASWSTYWASLDPNTDAVRNFCMNNGLDPADCYNAEEYVQTFLSNLWFGLYWPMLREAALGDGNVSPLRRARLHERQRPAIE